MREFMAVAKALADETRVRLLMAVGDRELCVCQLIDLAGLAPSTVSKHMAILKQARLVETRKQGRWVYYRLPEPEESLPVARDALEWVRCSVGETTEIRQDAKQLEKILKMAPEDLCDGLLRRRRSVPSLAASLR